MVYVFAQGPGNHQGFAYAVVAVVFLTLTWLVVVARLAARWSIKSLGWDDFFCVLAELGMTVFCVATFGLRSILVGNHYPTTVPLWELSFKWLITTEASFAAGMVFLKLSLGLFFLRIVYMRPQRTIIYIAMAISTLINTYAFFLSIFTCGLPSGNLLIKSLNGRCTPHQLLTNSGYARAAVNTATDILFAVIPFMLLWKSQLKRSVKVYVYSVLLLATTGCVASIVRFWYVDKFLSAKSNGYTEIFYLGIVSLVELGVGIIASSTATLRPLFRTCLPEIRTTNGGSSRNVRNITGHTDQSNETKDVSRSEYGPKSDLDTTRHLTVASGAPSISSTERHLINHEHETPDQEAFDFRFTEQAALKT